jgi:hypothetical protein
MEKCPRIRTAVPVAPARLLAGALALSGIAAWSCHQVPFTAPPGSLIQLSANPQKVPAYGGVSIISALVIEPAGTLVPDGTVVQFFTNMGTIDPQGKTNDGVATVKFVSDTRSGTATIQACSGGGATTAPTVAPTFPPIFIPTPTPPPTLFSMGSPASLTFAATAADTIAQGTGCVSVQIDVGSATVVRLAITSTPSRIRSGASRQSEIVATALNENGDPVANVPVIFTLEEMDWTTNKAIGPAKFEVMASAGNPVFTDNNGRAYDTLYTRYATDGATRLVRVTATVTTVKDPVTVFVWIN